MRPVVTRMYFLPHAFVYVMHIGIVTAFSVNLHTFFLATVSGTPLYLSSSLQITRNMINKVMAGIIGVIISLHHSQLPTQSRDKVHQYAKYGQFSKNAGVVTQG
jgi:hypothetical protein